jgi:hypothetical protein
MGDEEGEFREEQEQDEKNTADGYTGSGDGRLC